MKALYCRAFGPETDLTVEEIAAPVPAVGEVLVSVQAAGLNFPDLLCVRGEYQFKPPLPFVPGSEGAGVVSALGADVTGVSVDTMTASRMMLPPVIGLRGTRRSAG